MKHRDKIMKISNQSQLKEAKMGKWFKLMTKLNMKKFKVGKIW